MATTNFSTGNNGSVVTYTIKYQATQERDGMAPLNLSYETFVKGDLTWEEALKVAFISEKAKETALVFCDGKRLNQLDGWVMSA